MALILAELPRTEAHGGPIASVVLRHPADVLLLRMALARASFELAKPACQQLLDDFPDGYGRPLRENLATTGLEPADYPARLAYRDGADL